MTRVFGAEFDTTGWLGVTRGRDGNYVPLDVPAWMMLPGPQWLSMARSWHFFFAWVFVLNGLAFLALRDREPAPDARPRADAATSCAASARRSATTCASGTRPARRRKRYNVLQKLAYLVGDLRAAAADRDHGARDVAVARRACSRAGSTSSAAGSRRARSTSSSRGCWSRSSLIHVFQVIVTGLWNNLRSMITGRYRVRRPA